MSPWAAWPLVVLAWAGAPAGGIALGVCSRWTIDGRWQWRQVDWPTAIVGIGLVLGLPAASAAGHVAGLW